MNYKQIMKHLKGTETVFIFYGSHIKIHRLCGLNNRSIFYHSSEGYKSKIKVLAVLGCFSSFSPMLSDFTEFHVEEAIRKRTKDILWPGIS